jgi:hypothetical protein
MKKIQVKLSKTPETLAVDAGHTIQLVGSAALNVLAFTGIHKGANPVPPQNR